MVRPYWLVDDIASAVAAAVRAGAEVAHPPLEIPGHGTFAIYFQGGVEHGLWQLQTPQRVSELGVGNRETASAGAVIGQVHGVELKSAYCGRHPKLRTADSMSS